jgi:hypothetical protein
MHFYGGYLKKAIAIFGSRFNDIYITRVDESGDTQQLVKVPISYAPKGKFIARIQGDREGKRDVAIRLPQISFEITGIERDSTARSLLPMNKITAPGFNNFVGTPYDLTIELNVMTKTMEDGLKIIEQILPFYNPRATVKAALIDDINEVFDIPITLTTTAMTDTYENDFLTRRAIIWTLTFQMKTFFFGPTGPSKVIKFTTANIFSNPEMTAKFEKITVQPGLTANGQPTTKLSETINYLNINEDDPYGFIVIKTDEFDE